MQALAQFEVKMPLYVKFIMIAIAIISVLSTFLLTSYLFEGMAGLKYTAAIITSCLAAAVILGLSVYFFISIGWIT